LATGLPHLSCCRADAARTASHAVMKLAGMTVKPIPDGHASLTKENV
jgi:hypothetical protein